MPITQDSAVTLAYKITDAHSGKPLDAGTTAYLHGGYDNLFAQVEAALAGLEVGQSIDLQLAADQAWSHKKPENASMRRAFHLPENRPAHE